MDLQELKDLTRGINKVVTEATTDSGMRSAMTSFLMHKCIGESIMASGVRDELIKCGKKPETKPAAPRRPRVSSVKKP
jgi:hypothetical protein